MKINRIQKITLKMLQMNYLHILLIKENYKPIIFHWEITIITITTTITIQAPLNVIPLRIHHKKKPYS